MQSNNSHQIPNIFENTMAVMENARTTLKIKSAILEFHDADPNDIGIEILDYSACIDMLSDMIIDNTIIDEEMFNVIYMLAEKYYIYVKDEYPATGLLLKHYIAELDHHREMRFDA